MLIKVAHNPYSPTYSKKSYGLTYVDEVLDFSPQPLFEFTSNEALQSFVDMWNGQNKTRRYLNETRLTEFGVQGYDIAVRGDDLENLSEDKIYRVNKIDCRIGEDVLSIVFDTIAYICTDKGETIERCFAGGVLNKPTL